MKRLVSSLGALALVAVLTPAAASAQSIRSIVTAELNRMESMGLVDHAVAHN